MKKKRLAIVAKDRVVERFTYSYLRDIFGDAVEMRTFSIEDLKEPVTDCDVAVTSHTYFAPEVERLFPNAQVIPGHKMLSGRNLEQVLNLPAGKRVLVINTPRSLSVEVIRNLEELGIRHLTYVPLDQDVDEDSELYQGIDTAISPGMGHLVPPNISHIIDIGQRIFRPITFISLWRALELPDDYVEVYMAKYVEVLFQSAQKLASSLSYIETYLAEVETTLNEIDDGIIRADKAGNITGINRSAENMLGFSREKWIGKPVKSVFQRIGLSQERVEAESKLNKNVIFHYKKKTVACKRIHLDVRSNDSIFSFKEASKIVELESEIRHKLNEKGFVAKYNFEDIWGGDANLRKIKQKAETFAKTEQTILLTGESGVGKELFAQAIHLNSGRKNGPFLAVNFAAIPDSLIESELLGYSSGAFTGARREGKAGYFEKAHNGTLFLDEIGDIKMSAQVTLLRVLQEKEVIRVGGDRVIPVSVRIIAATNKDLAQLVEEGTFRRDLYYRINALPIEVPPLRSRKQDILPILNKRIYRNFGVEKTIPADIRRILTAYTWPGNVRELFNVADYIYYSSMERSVVELSDIPEYILSHHEKTKASRLPIADTESTENLFIRYGADAQCLTVLRAFISLQGEGLGRNRLLSEIQRYEPHMSEHRLKKILAELRDKGYIQTGTTKQGSSITPEGIAYYRSKAEEAQGAQTAS